MEQLYFIVAFFLIYAFMGWALEVAFHVVSVGQFINRGFLNGPLCPIYGVGMLIVMFTMKPFASSLLLLFVGGIIFATLVELIGGFALFKIFNLRWWDYSGEPFNLGGYICPKFSLAWGICIVFSIEILNPSISKLIRLGNNIVGYIIVSILSLIFVADLIITVCAVAKLNRDLKYIRALVENVRVVSDGLTDKIGNTTLKAANTVQKGQVQAALAKSEFKEELETLKAHARGLWGYGSLMKAFPQMKHAIYNEELISLIYGVKQKTSDILERIYGTDGEE